MNAHDWSVIVVFIIFGLALGFTFRQSYQKKRRMTPEKKEILRCFLCGEPMTSAKEELWVCKGVDHIIYYFRGMYYSHAAWKLMQEKMQEKNRKNYHTTKDFITELGATEEDFGLLTEDDTKLFKSREN
jgi:hypothetical protein